VSKTPLEVVKLAILVAGFALLLFEMLRAGRAAQRARTLDGAWGILAVLSIAALYRFSPARVVETYDTYDLVHYYLNAKYFPELGYTRLYQACLVADMEGRNRLRNATLLRDLYDQQVKGAWFIRQVREHPEEIKRHFSPARWRSFRRDFRVLDRLLWKVTWRRILIDRGYNATPTWHAVGHALASAVPARHVKWLCQIDTLLVIAMFLVIAWVAGRRTAAIAIVWFCTGFSAYWPGVGMALLRYDWLATVVIGTCLVGRGRRFWGGAFIGWATLSRIFPAIVLLIPFVRGVHMLVVQRRLDRGAVTLAAGFLLVVGLGTAATWAKLGSDHFVAFRHDLEIQLAPENLSINRMGLAVALAYRGETADRELPVPHRRGRYLLTGRMGPIRTALGVLLLALLALSILLPAGSTLPARQDEDLTQLGFFGFALLLTASFYYWTTRLLPLLMHARHRAHSRRDALGLLSLFGIEIGGWTLDLVLHYQYALTAITSIAVSLYAAAVCVVRGRAALRRRRAQLTRAAVVR